jgi:hypothetical protein
MISLTAQQPFSLILFKRKPYGQHRLYLKEDPYYRYTKIFLTRLGFAGVGLAVVIGTFFTALTLLSF